MIFRSISFTIALLSASPLLLHAADMKFSFDSKRPVPGSTLVVADQAFDKKRGFGFVNKAGNARVFGVRLEEGNYHVSLLLGDSTRPTSTTVKAENRRLMLEKAETSAGKFEVRTFTVNVRKPPISTGGNTTLNDREKGPPVSASWDDLLTLEFNGESPGVAALEIKPATDVTTVFIAGDSTVTDQRNEPWAGWGQMLPRFFERSVAVSNQAESGLALRSFERQKRLDKVLSMLKKGDYLFIQFGHNDQKDKAAGAGPFTSYKENLKRYVERTHAKGGVPVLVTPMERRRWEGSSLKPTLSDYAEAVRQVGAEDKVPVIDLNAMSIKLYTALGPDPSMRAFAFYPANTFPGQSEALKDNTHHNTFGAYELARCMVEGIRAQVPELATHLSKDAGTFDPAKPDAPDQVKFPLSPPSGAVLTPEGS